MSSIPLPALAVRPPEQGPSPLQQFAQIQSIKGLMQQNQMGNVQLQQAQQAQKDQQTLGQLMIKNRGNIDKVIQDAPDAGVMPNTILQLQQHALDVKTKLQSYDTDALKNFATRNDNARGLIQPIVNAKPEDQPALYAAARQTALQNPQAYGITDPNQIPEQFPGADALKTQIALHQGGAQQASDAIKERETKAKEMEAQTRQTQANTASQRFQAEMPGGAMQPVEQKELSDYLAKNPGKGPIDFAKTKAGFSAQAGASAQAGLLSDAAKQMAAQNYTQTGALPTGLRSPAMSAQVLNQAASGPNGIPNIAANKMNYKADSGSLAALQKNFDQVTAFENTAGKNLDVFLNQAQKVVDSGNPMINRPLRTIVGSMGGTDQAAFDTARTTALTEIAKVLNSSNASGVLSDSARHEVEGLIKPNATLAQIVSAAKILKTDMGNRHDSYQQQIDAIKARGNPQATQAQPAPGGMIQARDPQGKLHQAPAGTALPAGWKLEQ